MAEDIRVAVLRSISYLDDLIGEYHPRDFAVRFWDGTVWGAEPGQPARFTLVLKHPGGLRAMFWPPGEISLVGHAREHVARPHKSARMPASLQVSANTLSPLGNTSDEPAVALRIEAIRQISDTEHSPPVPTLSGPKAGRWDRMWTQEFLERGMKR